MIRRLLSTFGAGLLGLLPLTALAQPANDDCSGAIELFPAGTCNPVSGTVLGATQSIPGTVLCDGFDATPDDDVWYRFTATSTDHVIRVQGSPSFDAVIQLLSGACDGTPIVCRDVVGAGGAEVLTTTGLTVGQEYLIRVFHWAATPPATPGFEICITGIVPPPNDDCVNAVTLVPSPACVPVAGTTANATGSIPGLVNCDGFNANPNDDVWYRFIATSTDHTITVAGGSGFDAVIQLRSGSCLGTAVVCRDLAATGQPEVLDATGLTVGEEYLIRVFHWAAAPPTTPEFSICLQGPAPASCEADASTLSPNRPEVCFEFGPTLIDAAFDTPPTVPPGFAVLHVLTTGPDLTIVDVSADPAFLVEAMGLYTIHTLVYDPATLDLSGVVLGVTQAGEILGQLIQGGGSICGSLDVNGAEIAVIDCNACIADAGTITADASTVCLEDGAANITATHDGNSVAPSGYVQLYVLTQGPDLTIIGAGTEPFFIVSDPGNYTVHTLVFDPATLDLGIVEFGVTTAFAVLDYITANGICASLDAVGAPVTVEVCATCTADAGTITADEPTVCFDLDLSQAVISATPDGNAVVPSGFEKAYVLTAGSGLVIEQISGSPSFTVFAPGAYTIHTLVFDPATFDQGIVEFGVTTGADVLAYIASAGICASLDATGTPITVQYCIVCDADAGSLVIDQTPVCLMLGEAQVGAAVANPLFVPAGFEVAFALSQGANLTIVALNSGPVFSVSQPGTYTIHTLVYDPATIDPGIIELGVTTGFDINALLVQGGGIICGALDVAGATVTVNDCSPANNDCIGAAPLPINAIADCPANAVTGDNTYATMDGGVPSCDDAGSYLLDVWYTFNAGENTEVTLNLDPGTMEDWAVAIYDGCGGNELACYITPAEPIVIPTSAFTDYVVQVYSNFTYGNGGQFTICLSGAVPTVICDGGLVQTTSGFFSVDVCQDAEADVIDFTNNSNSNEDYAYLLTDDNDVIIAVLVDGSLDFNSAPLGLYRVWGVSFNGTLTDAEPGLLATGIGTTGTCLALSSNYVQVNVEICSGIAGAGTSGWTLFPNPGTGDFNLIAPADGLVQVEVLDLGGRVAHAGSATMTKGQPMAFNLQGQLASGAYTVRLTGQGQVATLRLVVR